MEHAEPWWGYWSKENGYQVLRAPGWVTKEEGAGRVGGSPAKGQWNVVGVGEEAIAQDGMGT